MQRTTDYYKDKSNAWGFSGLSTFKLLIIFNSELKLVTGHGRNSNIFSDSARTCE